MRHCIPLVGALALLAAAPNAAAGTLYVDANLTTGLDDGSSWADAFQGSDGLRRALFVASAGDRVFAAEGTYLPTTTGARNVPFAMADGVELYGGFVGTESAPQERPPMGSAPTVLSGDLNGNDPLTADNSRAIFDVNGLSPSAVLDGLVIQGANNDAELLPGGGLTCASSGSCSPTVRGCHIRMNFSHSGAAFSFLSPLSSPKFTDCVFENNAARVLGGAGIVTAASLPGESKVFDRCVFRDNIAPLGGALHLRNAAVFVLNCVFEGNASVDGGGAAVFVEGTVTGDVRFFNNTVVGNVTSAPEPNGAVHVEATTPVSVVNCILWDNEGPGGTRGAGQQLSGAGATYSIVAGGLAGEGNLASDPQFVDAAGSDYSLALSSPAVDAGSNVALPPTIVLDHARNPRYTDEITVPDTGLGAVPVIDIGARERVPLPVPSFCDASDGSLASCPCANPGAPDAGCDVAQGTGGVRLAVLTQFSGPNRATMTGTGFPNASFPTSVVVRAPTLDPSQPVAFGDGLRCIGTPLVRLAASTASVGIATHTLGHGAMAGSFHYQLWFRNTPASYCTPEAFNLSNGISLTW